MIQQGDCNNGLWDRPRIFAPAKVSDIKLTFLIILTIFYDKNHKILMKKLFSNSLVDSNFMLTSYA